MTTLVALAISVLGPGADTLVLNVLVALLGFASVGWLPVCLTLIAEIAGPRAAGAATGVVMTAANFGVVIGPPVFGLVVDLTTDYRLAWWFLSTASFVATAFVLRLPESPRALTNPAI